MPKRTGPRIDAAERDARAMELRAVGASYRQIARQLGISASTAWTCVERGLGRTRREAADHLRTLEAERLDRLQAETTKVLQAQHVVIQAGKVILGEDGKPYTDHGPILAAVNALVKVQESRRRLLGLDAPSRHQIDAKVRTVDEIDARIAELEALLGETATPDELYERNRQKALGMFDQVVEHAGVDVQAERDASTRALTFRQAWRSRPVGDAADFVADALDLAVNLLDVSAQEQQEAARAVERLLQERLDDVS